MGKTLTHEISYPDGGGVPNVPVAMQAQAESTDKAISRISEAPFIVCGKKTTQGIGAVSRFENVTWEEEVWKQGITHDTSKNSDQFIIQEDGLYTCNAKVGWNNYDTTSAVVINVNGVDRLTSQSDQTGTVTAWPKPQTITDLKLSKGDIVRVRTSGTKTSIKMSPAECFFSLRKSAGFES